MNAVVVVYQGNASAPFAIPIAAIRPGTFTRTGGGTGQGAMLVQDQSANRALNRVAGGSWISSFAGGESVTMPPGVWPGIE
jgi:uncharacterized protein (TIGR03437 family)